MSKRRVVYNGVEMDDGWPQRIVEAQSRRTILIAGVQHQRVRYGDEAHDWGADRHPCHDCAVIKGQLHVPSCDAEQCPACGGQSLACDCRPEKLKIKSSPRPFTQREQSVIAARKLFTWQHTGFAANGDATFEVGNWSSMHLPFLTIGVRGPQLRGGAWLSVSDIAPGSRAAVQHDCYKALVTPIEVEFFDVDDPTPESRDRFWEFKRLSKPR